jgi:hypothetical protein
MGSLADTEKTNRDERKAFLSGLVSDVSSKLQDYSKARKEMAQKARDERQALLLSIRKQVTDLRKQAPAVKAVEAPAPAAPKIAPTPVKPIVPAPVAKVEPPKPKPVEPPPVAKVEPPKPKPVEPPVVAKIDPPKPKAPTWPVVNPWPKAAPVAVALDVAKAKVVEPPVVAKVVPPRAKNVVAPTLTTPKPAAPPKARQPKEKKARAAGKKSAKAKPDGK